jgi:valyl-tRNA synthetase
MSEIPKAYDPRAVEDRWYQFWLDAGCFTADPARVSARRPAYSIVIPPPNVTGVLTMGHVLNNTLQDILARKARMDGKEVLWLPGTDHAGIATQTVVEKTLRKQGLIRHRDDLGREKFLEHVWAWKDKHGGIIIQQLKKLGCSCDWTRERFTMDPEYSRCVQRVFVDLYRKGRIYRGKRMVNWCPVSLTALSDEEVIMKEQKGYLYYFRVQVVEADGSPVQVEAASATPGAPPAPAPGPAAGAAGPGDAAPLAYGPETDAEGRTWLTIATTRPETIPADTAVAVNPADPRYARFIGKFVKRALPLENQALLPIVGDEHIDISFGTGVLKVTPAHDAADYEIGLRHRLPVIEVIEANGRLNERAGRDLAGLDRVEARAKAAELLRAAGALVKAEPYVNNVGFSERADVPIEPRLSEQWFLKYPSVEKARACVAAPGDASPDKLQFHPDRWAKVYDHWMANLKDWCISRQLWWGHRIPVWYSEGHGKLNRRMVVTVLTGRELAGQNIKELRQSAWDYAARHGILGQDFLNLDTGQTITVRKSSLEHGFSNFGVANVKLIPGLPGLLRHALRVAVEPHRPASAQVLAVETYLAALRLGDQFFRVKFRVKVFPPNFRLYDHQTVLLWREKQSEPDGVKSPEARAPKDPASRPASGSEIHLADLVADVNHDPAFTRCQIEPPGPGWTQDPDVLDTWFSSWLWPFATMGWTGDPARDARNATLQTFYPTTDLVTGPDIIFFWVARMIMAGYEFMGQMPFRHVYFTGIIRDKLGRKMSKSLGNSPDPLELIAKYGADALRFGTLRSAPLGQDVLFDEQNVELGRNFCNKLWNACRFRQLQGGAVEAEIQPAGLSSDDRWILLRLDQAIREVTQAFAEYKFSEAAAVLHRFFWSEYCDWYVEASKAALAGTDAARRANTLAVMDFVLNHTLRLFHPFLPFITEELWHGLGYHHDLPETQGGRTIMFAPWPKPLSQEEKTWFGLDEAADRFAAAKYDLVSRGRNLRREFNLPAGKKLRYVLRPAAALPPAEVEVLRLLLNAEAVDVDPAYQPPRGTPSAANALGELFLPLAGQVDFAAERARLTRELEKARVELGRVRDKLANPDFARKVPPPVLAEHQRRLAEWQERERQLEQALANLPAQ